MLGNLAEALQTLLANLAVSVRDEGADLGNGIQICNELGELQYA